MMHLLIVGLVDTALLLKDTSFATAFGIMPPSFDSRYEIGQGKLVKVCPWPRVSSRHNSSSHSQISIFITVYPHQGPRV